MYSRAIIVFRSALANTNVAHGVTPCTGPAGQGGEAPWRTCHEVIQTPKKGSKMGHFGGPDPPKMTISGVLDYIRAVALIPLRRATGPSSGGGAPRAPFGLSGQRCPFCGNAAFLLTDLIHLGPKM